jgi:hypothetical protein
MTRTRFDPLAGQTIQLRPGINRRGPHPCRIRRPRRRPFAIYCGRACHVCTWAEQRRFSRQLCRSWRRAGDFPVQLQPIHHVLPVGMSIAFLIGSQRRLRFAGLFWPCLAKLRNKPGPLDEEAWRSRRDAKGLARPCFRSDAVRKQDDT